MDVPIFLHSRRSLQLSQVSLYPFPLSLLFFVQQFPLVSHKLLAADALKEAIVELQ